MSGDRPGPHIFTIGASRPFADALVAGVIARHGGGKGRGGGDPLALARGMLLLPNQRAISAVRDAFVRAGGAAMLLPRLVALGDDDLEDAAGAALDRFTADAGPALPPAIEPMRRRAVLARLVAAHRPDILVGEALRLADTLARLLDELAIEELALSDLIALADEGAMAGHWQDAFRLLIAIGEAWPQELARIGLIDRTRRRNAELDQASALWREQGLPAQWLIAAGISTSAPAVARLLRTVAMAPNGAVVLSWLDRGMAAEQWDALGSDPKAAAGDEPFPPRRLETHPQFHLKLLLDRMGIARDEVEDWPGNSAGPATNRPPASAQREVVLRHLLAPARFTADWPMLAAPDRTLGGVVALELATPAEEAQAIALAMREALDVPGKTVALITPDRAIATRVSAHLARWGLVADDSAGQPLAATPPAACLLALAQVVASGCAPVELIALLNHPLVSSEEGRREWVDRARLLDRALRGPRPAVSIANMAEWINARFVDDEAMLAWWGGVYATLSTAGGGDDGASAPLPLWFARFRDALGQLSGDRIWSGAAGRALSSWYEEAERHAGEFGLMVDAAELPGIMRLLMDGATVRPPQGGHPRLKIWGLLEARLQRADRVILAGLNEGQWPPIPTPDPWLAPMIRRRLGLPGLERRIGLASHDFATALGCPEVLITRATKAGGAPTIASRLKLRIDALAGQLPTSSRQMPDFGMIARAVDHRPGPRPIARPRLSPPAAHRPQALSVTEVDTLLSDPFAFYARNALGLFALDALDAEPTAAWRGTAIHKLMADWLRAGDWTVEAMTQRAHALLGGAGVSPVARILWKPRLLAPLLWCAEQVVANLAEGRAPVVAATEQRGAITIGGVTLSGTPDRIDRLADGSLAIVDYKSGDGPAKNAVDAGYALQLGLLGLMAQQGAFTGQVEAVSCFEYWRMNKKDDHFGRVDTPFKRATTDKTTQVTGSNFVDVAQDRLRYAIDHWLCGDDPFVAKLVPDFAQGADYDRLMRLEEWYGQDGAAPAHGAEAVP